MNGKQGNCDGREALLAFPLAFRTFPPPPPKASQDPRGQLRKDRLTTNNQAP